MLCLFVIILYSINTVQLLLLICFLSMLFIKGEGGASEKIICFCCNKGFSSWKSGSNPWLQHARQSANCTFIQLLMGKLYVQNAKALSNESFNTLEMIPEVNISLIIVVQLIL